ncbi:uncharacterized protein LOC107370795 [Tetranychus urticae]|uniref:uncharacterized protein LOC107370795 n=1 Tax=Tetranychus urticae TaxID=32264 RepID=UPI000D658930|nr:uncharacterized protein LOC107370795 [Tetranychus urticae]
MEKNIHKNGYKLVNGSNSSPKHTYKINLERTKIPRIRQVNGVIKGKSQHSSQRKIIPSFYGFLTIFVVTLLVILVNKIPTGPRSYPDLQYQARLKANYFKPIANLSQFVLETELLIKPRLDELEDIRLVVIVSSSVQHFDQRQAIRDTWSKLINYHQQKLFFIIGKPTPQGNSLDNSSISNSSKHMSDDANKLTYPIFDHQNNPSDPMMSKLNEQIVQEDLSFNDLIQYDFYDSYYNLTLKSLLILRYFNQEILNLTKSPSPFPSYHSSLSYGSSSSPSSSLLSPFVTPKMPNRPYGRLKPPPIVPNGMNLKIKKPIFLFKVDDDMFVQVNNLIKLIDKLMVAFKVRKIPWNHRQEGYKILLGGLIKKAQPIRDPKSKYFVPFSVYPYNIYPNYLSGTGYLMSADVARSLFITTTVAVDIFFSKICISQDFVLQKLLKCMTTTDTDTMKINLWISN